MTDTVQVRPAIQGEVLVHPSGVVATSAGAAWPADQFTFRRLGDGSLVLVDPDEPSPHDTPVLATDVLASHRLSFAIADLAAFLALPGTTIGDLLQGKAETGDLAAAVANLQTALAGKASPADINAAVAKIVGAAPSTLDTLVEIDSALNNDPNFGTTVMTALAGKQPLDADLTAIAALATQAFGRSLLTQADAASARSALGLTTTAGVSSFNNRTGDIIPAANDYAVADINGLTSALAAKAARAASPTANNIATLDASGNPKDSGIKFGTGPGNAVQFDGAGRYPPGDGSQITGITQSRYSRVVMLTSSQTWVAPANIRGRVTVIGGAGSGGAAKGYIYVAASGGAAGGYAVKNFSASSGVNFTATIGAAGAPVNTGNVASALVQGNAGGASSFVGGGLNIVANAGSGGSAAGQSSIATATVAAGALGGTASGGDFNYTGGGSGTATVTSTVAGASSGAAATGGGATSYFGVGYPSGAATASLNSTVRNTAVATGGAGVGGSSGSCAPPAPGGVSGTGGGSGSYPSPANNLANSQSPGGADVFGANGSGTYWTVVGTNARYGVVPVTSFTTFNLNGRGGRWNVNASGEYGDDGCGSAAVSSIGSTAYSPGYGGLFAGGGANAQYLSSAAGGYGGVAQSTNGFQCGGGGGGASLNATDAGTNASGGGGGPGLIIIEYDVVS